MGEKLDVSGMQPLAAAKRHFDGIGTPTAGGVAERRALEKPPRNPLDGRVARGKGRNIPLNFRVTEDFKQRFLMAAQERDITMTQLLEEAFAALEASTQK